MQIYGKEVDFKISRLKDAGNMELALKNMEKAEIKAKEGKTIQEILGAMIQVFRQFFIDATGRDVLAECEDLEEAKEAYLAFLEEVKQQKATVLNFSVSDIK